MTDQATAAMMEKAREIATWLYSECADGRIPSKYGTGIPDTLMSLAAALSSQAEIVGELVGALATARDYVHAEVAENGDDADRADLALIDTALAKARSAGL